MEGLIILNETDIYKVFEVLSWLLPSYCQCCGNGRGSDEAGAGEGAELDQKIINSLASPLSWPDVNIAAATAGLWLPVPSGFCVAHCKYTEAELTLVCST